MRQRTNTTTTVKSGEVEAGVGVDSLNKLLPKHLFVGVTRKLSKAPIVSSL